MSRVLLAAHDTGGANILAPIYFELINNVKYDVRFYVAGPARKVLTNKVRFISENIKDIEDIVNEFNPKMIITGTSEYSDFERNFWDIAKAKHILSFAILDAWINIKIRFLKKSSNNYIEPDIIGVVDEDMKQELEISHWCNATLEVTGQAHLESVASRINMFPQTNSIKETKLLFISEPYLEKKLTEKLGYNQYQIIECLLANLTGMKSYKVVIKPHPNEPASGWNNWMNKHNSKNHINISICNENIEKLIASTDLVLGITSMSLIEAAIAGKPVLAIQLGQAANPNPAIEKIGAIKILNEIEDIEMNIERELSMKNNINSKINISSKFKNSKLNTLKIIKDNL